MRRALVGLVVTLVVATGCSTSSHEARPSTAASSTTVAPSAAGSNRRACAAYEALWNTDYAGGEPSPTMVARERALVDAAEATPDRALHDAIRGVIEGDLGLPRFYLRDTAPKLNAEANQLPPDVQAALHEVRRNDRLVRSKCDAIRPSTTPIS